MMYHPGQQLNCSNMELKLKLKKQTCNMQASHKDGTYVPRVMRVTKPFPGKITPKATCGLRVSQLTFKRQESDSMIYTTSCASDPHFLDPQSQVWFEIPCEITDGEMMCTCRALGNANIIRLLRVFMPFLEMLFVDNLH